MINAFEGKDVPVSSIGVLRERRMVANLQHLRIAVRAACLEHQRSRAADSAYQRSDS